MDGNFGKEVKEINTYLEKINGQIGTAQEKVGYILKVER
jgi:hypothetical protein